MIEKENVFGSYLKAARQRKYLSLREVEGSTGISNAYLSQLEKGKIKQPSPVMLHKLAEAYEVSYTELFTLVGYPIPDTSEDDSSSTFAKRVGSITAEEEHALEEYLQFLRMKRRKED